MNIETYPDNPLPYSELKATAKSVERYRREWRADGNSVSFRERQRARGRMGNAAKQAAKMPRNEAIIAARKAGKSAAQIAIDTRLTKRQVNRILKSGTFPNTDMGRNRPPPCADSSARQGGGRLTVLEQNTAENLADLGRLLENRREQGEISRK